MSNREAADILERDKMCRENIEAGTCDKMSCAECKNLVSESNKVYEAAITFAISALKRMALEEDMEDERD